MADGIAVDDQEALIADLTSDRPAGDRLAPVEQALMKYAEKLTRAPGEITAQDVDMLRSAGLDDRAIHDACAIVAYFAFVNRTADGLGVELER